MPGPLFLYGPPGAGKTTLGQALASSLGLPFLDTDQALEAQTGQSIAQLMQSAGQTAFRALESGLLRQICQPNPPEQIIALGGGSLLAPQNRAMVEKSGPVLVLLASPNSLLERLRPQAETRPLLAENLPEKLSTLLQERAEHYASFPRRLFTDNQTPQALCQAAQTALGHWHLRALGDYPVRLGRLEEAPASLSKLRSCLVVSDENVAPLHAQRLLQALRQAGLQPGLFTLPVGETFKTLESVQSLWQAFLQAGLDRHSLVFALGGGVIGDLTGFAAATFMRGIRWAALPSTLLAMVDASLGGKTGFDLPQGKNLIGAFYPPALVLADPGLLATLPPAEFTSGMAEVVKHGMLADPLLFEQTGRGARWARENLSTWLPSALAVKIKFIESDPYERAERALLNLGHTLGHAVELVSGFRLRHGEAVAIGLAGEAHLAQRLGLCQASLPQAVCAVLQSQGLPIEIPPSLAREDLLAAMRHDKKKRGNSLLFALPREIGRAELIEVTDLEAVL